MASGEAFSEDYKTRSQEIQQIVAHRFQLITLAILVFSAVSGWLTTYLARLPANIEKNAGFVVSVLLPSVSILLILILMVLYYEYFALLRTLRIFSTYLLVRFKSRWETDWEAYREHKLTRKYSGYSKSGFRVFSFLALLSVAYPSFFLIPYREIVVWRWALPLLSLVVLLLITFLRRLYRTTYQQDKYIDQEGLVKGWQLVVSERNEIEKGNEHVAS